MSLSRRYDFSIDYKYISERIALLTQEIVSYNESNRATAPTGLTAHPANNESFG